MGELGNAESFGYSEKINTLKAINDFALLTLDRGFIEDKVLTESGFWLYLSEDYLSNPNIHITCTGIMNFCPDRITPVEEKNTMDAMRRMLYRDEIGFPDYSQDTLKLYSGSHHELYNEVYSDQIKIDLKGGDRVYFFHDAIEKDDKVGGLYRINYRSIICSERDGEITMNASYCLLTPYYTENSTDSVVKTKNGLIYAINKPVPQFGIVEHIGNPLTGQDVICEKGDVVMYEVNYDYSLIINHKMYYVTPQYRMFGKLTPN